MSRRAASLIVVAVGSVALIPFLQTHAQQASPAPAAVQDPKAAQAAALKAAADGTLGTVGETHLRKTRQVTCGGQNAEAYFSADDKSLIFQHQGQFYAPSLEKRALWDPGPATAPSTG